MIAQVPSVSDHRQIHAHNGRRKRHGDDVRIFHNPCGFDNLIAHGIGEGCNSIAQNRGFFIIKSFACRIHLGFKSLNQNARLTGKEAARIGHVRFVIGLGDCADTGRRTAPHLSHKTRTRTIFKDGILTGSDSKNTL